MKFTVWCVGGLVILCALMQAYSTAPAWRWVWFTLGGAWIFVGVGLVGVAVAKLATGKWRTGALMRAGDKTHNAPAVPKEE